MEYGKLLFFSTDFFTDTNSVRSYIKSAYNDVNNADEKSKNSEALVKALLIKDLARVTEDHHNKALLLIAEINMLNFVAYRKGSKTIYLSSKNKINQLLFDRLNENLRDAYYAIKGEVYLQLFTLNKKEEAVDYTIEGNNLLYIAKKCYSFLLNRYLSGNISIEGANTQKILIHYCEVLGHLSRYVEPFYLLNRINNSTTKYKASIPLAEILLLEAIFEKTCNSSNPLILVQIRSAIKKAKKNIDSLDSRNIPVLKRIDNGVNKMLNEYCELNNISQEKMRKMIHDGKAQNKLNNYEKFILKNQLFLNEHFLYCQCKVGTNDNLKIKSTCLHTNNINVRKYELSLDKMKYEFDGSRQSYYRATEEKGRDKIFKRTVKSSEDIHDDIINSSQSYELINSFTKCFSILDKIAVNVNSAFSILEGKECKKIYFNSYFKRKVVKRVINNNENNLYLIAMHSISQDLDKGNPLSEFAEYKDWRNSLEHNELYLINEDADINSLKKIYPNAEYFIPIKEFTQKTLYLLHLCRSAIFTFTWVIRKASKKWDEEE